MSDAYAIAMHHQTLRDYRRELRSSPPGLNRLKLATLIARLEMTAKERGWPKTPEEAEPAQGG